VQAGDRFPWFLEHGQDVCQKLTGTRFTLFALGDWSAQHAALEGLRSEVLEVVCMSNPVVEIYKQTGLTDGLYLVRPDGYIGMITKDVTEVQTYLSQSIGLKSAPTRPVKTSLRT
jgi:hypothetical protein